MLVYQATHDEAIAESEGIAQHLRQAQNVRRKRKAPLALIGIEAPPVVTAPSTEATATIPAKSKATTATPPSTEATTTTHATDHINRTRTQRQYAMQSRLDTELRRTCC